MLLNACMVDMSMSQIIADSVRIFFQPGSSWIQPGSNGNALSVFAREVRRCGVSGNLERLVVRAYTSPDGVSTANLRLSADRCQAVADYILGLQNYKIMRIQPKKYERSIQTQVDSVTKSKLKRNSRVRRTGGQRRKKKRRAVSWRCSENRAEYREVYRDWAWIFASQTVYL